MYDIMRKLNIFMALIKMFSRITKLLTLHSNLQPEMRSCVFNGRPINVTCYFISCVDYNKLDWQSDHFMLGPRCFSTGEALARGLWARPRLFQKGAAHSRTAAGQNLFSQKNN